MSNEKHEVEAPQAKIIADLVAKEVVAIKAEYTTKIENLQRQVDDLRRYIDRVASNVPR
jgi:hypothetical protein